MTKFVKVVTHHENPERAAELFAKDKVVAIGFNRAESIERKTKDQIKQMLIDQGVNPEWGTSQLIKFRDGIEIGDTVIAYRKKNTIALIGEVTGEYDFNNKNEVGRPEEEGGGVDYPNQRRVLWRDKPRNFNRNLLPEDLSKLVTSRGTIRIINEVNVSRFNRVLASI